MLLIKCLALSKYLYSHIIYAFCVTVGQTRFANMTLNSLETVHSLRHMLRNIYQNLFSMTLFITKITDLQTFHTKITAGTELSPLWTYLSYC